MKKFHIVTLVFVGFISQIMYTSEQTQRYSNTITSVTQINNSVVFMFEKDLPVCNYAPANYEESKSDSQIHRFFIPQTTFANGVSSTLNMRESEGGIEVVFVGKKVSKYNSTRMVSFHVVQ